MAEALGRRLVKGREDQEIKGIRPASGAAITTHHQFVDDTILTGVATRREAEGMKKILEDYEHASNQKINMEKSSLFFVNTPRNIQCLIGRTLGCRIQELPTSYLGLPLFTGRMKMGYWDPLLERIQKKLAGWKGACLSLAGKVVLLKAVLQSLPLYWMSMFEIPRKVAEKIESIQKQFLWSGTEEKKKIPLIKWEKVCLPKEEGGLSLRRARETNHALLGKMAWRLKTGEEAPWKDILKRKYMGDPEGPSHTGSAIWKAILGRARMIEEGSRWQLGDGSRISFWQDKWIKDQPLQENQEVGTMANILENLFGRKVQEYMQAERGEWKVIETQREEDRERLVKLNQWLRETHIPRFPKADKMIWGRVNSGEYTVKTGYDLVRTKGTEEEIFKKIWRNKAMPKAVAFLWLSARNKILTLDNLQKRGWSLPNRCTLCKEEEETVDHILLHCRYSREVWEQALRALQVSWVFPQTWRAAILEWTTRLRAARIIRLWEISLAHIAWSIWKERNQRIFQGKEREARVTWILAREAIKEALTSTKNQGKKEQGVEEVIRRTWGLPIVEEEAENPRRQVKWVPPPEGWIKLNVDGAAKGNPGEAGGGGIIRNNKGEILWAFTEYLGTQTNHRAEMRAMWQGIQGCEKLGPGKVIIEGDSLNIIRLLRGETNPDWRHESLIRDMRESLKRWEEVKIQHTYREGNKVADHLANRGVNLKRTEQWETGFPDQVKELAKEDQPETIQAQ